jgi:hypothetical protein
MECECYFCGKEAMMDEAVEAGWIPYFYNAKGREIDSSCPECAKLRLRIDEHGEFEMIPVAV